jgi:uncharacterized protein (DUF305 family)
MTRLTSWLFRMAVLVALLPLAAACSPGERREAEDTGATPANAPAAGGDTTMAGMDHSRMAGMQRGPATDADQEFLRMMADHDEGLIQMADAAMERASGAAARADAKRVHDKLHEERDRMVQMLRSAYNETLTPTVMPEDKAMSDSLQALSRGTQYDRALYRQLVMHHRRSIRMIDDYLPRLQRADVRRMAEQMRVEMTREIAEFERKAGGRS